MYRLKVGYTAAPAVWLRINPRSALSAFCCSIQKAEFEHGILRDRVKAGIAQARKEGRPHGRPPTVRHHAAEISTLFKEGISKRQIAARLSISQASVRRMLPAHRQASRAKLARKRA